MDPAFRARFEATVKPFAAPSIMSLATLRGACGCIGLALRDDQVKDLSALFDANGDGKVMSEEFVLFCNSHAEDVFAMVPPPPRGHLVSLEFLPPRTHPASSRAVPLCRGISFGARGDEATMWATFVLERDVKVDKKLSAELISDVVLFHSTRDSDLQRDGFECLNVRPVGDSWLGHGEHLWARHNDRDTIGDMVVTVGDAGPPYAGFRRVAGDLNLGGGQPVQLWYYKTKYDNDTLQAKHARRRELVVEDALAQFRAQCLRLMPPGKWTNASPVFAKLNDFGSGRGGGGGGPAAAAQPPRTAAGGPVATTATLSEEVFTAGMRRLVPVELSDFEIASVKARVVRSGIVSLANLQEVVCREPVAPAGPVRLLISALLPAVYDSNANLIDLFQVCLRCRERQGCDAVCPRCRTMR